VGRSEAWIAGEAGRDEDEAKERGKAENGTVEHRFGKMSWKRESPKGGRIVIHWWFESLSNNPPFLL